MCGKLLLHLDSDCFHTKVSGKARKKKYNSKVPVLEQSMRWDFFFLLCPSWFQEFYFKNYL